MIVKRPDHRSWWRHRLVSAVSIAAQRWREPSEAVHVSGRRGGSGGGARNKRVSRREDVKTAPATETTGETATDPSQPLSTPGPSNSEHPHAPCPGKRAEHTGTAGAGAASVLAGD
jgi:hypothetical protein